MMIKTIWITLLLIASIGYILSFFSLRKWQTSRVIAFHIFFSLPILSTIVMYGVLLHTLKQKADIESNKTRETKKATAKLIKGVVICMVVFNVPYIALWQYAHVVGWPKVLKSFWMVIVFN